MASSKLVVFCSFLLTLVLLLAFQGAARELLDVASKTNRQLTEDFPWGHGYINNDSKP